MKGEKEMSNHNKIDFKNASIELLDSAIVVLGLAIKWYEAENFDREELCGGEQCDTCNLAKGVKEFLNKQNNETES